MNPTGTPTDAAGQQAWIEVCAGQWDRLASALTAVDDFSAPTPTCPGWTIDDLVSHLAGIGPWIEASLTAEERPAWPTRPTPDDRAEWIRNSAERLLEALRRRPFDAPAWTLWPPRTTAFWPRRLAHELAIHRFDLAQAVAGAGAEADWQAPDWLALDGLDEALFGNWPRQIARGSSTTSPRTVQLVVAAGADSPRTVLTVPGTDPEAEPIVIEGSPRELYLAVWGRGRDLGLPPMTS
ncbi:MAG: maleylpyruvate isomerase family mycothiol-dependent enzyme [Propionibacteriaceae bacterium]|jgi:uncharacterized protein (TIGR03083 family)|nr:maleylpyruvate isomerase family mycothiol-dependent enzyme [Propionibacteriaceae bacterium]